ncbi:ABC transporter permease [[Clostridium] polysaccharolyticum]|uniref:FtsX-like permease family protein n=1 Tax=[Clostridium] polysaccharolyticum TaxID=29364 RepID=A0A1H9Z752_9FIRM|nr:ABC transporter permease [[Clostridium] polysaccharolyticum]SES77307.1 FtsX-like permease family protein [[Clostridium] polysaccharolyticum]
MRQYFHRTGLLFAIFIMVAMLFSLCSIAIVNNRHIEKILPILSEHYAVIQNSGNETIPLSKYRDAFEDMEKGYTSGVLFSDGHNRALYSSDKTLEKLPMASGRIFEKSDYVTKADVVLIREDMKTLCESREGKQYYRYNGAEFRVVGIYKDRKHSDITSAKCIFNLWSKSLGQFTEWSAGFFDTGEDSLQVLGNLKSFSKLELEYYSVQSEKGDVFSDVVDNLKFMLMLYIGVAMLVFLNVFLATSNWLSGKQKEIAIRKMVGACKRQIYVWLTGSFLSLVILSVFIGALLVKLILVVINTWDISPSMVLMFGDSLSWSGIFVTLAMILGIGLLIILCTLKWQLEKEIIQVIRREL